MKDSSEITRVNHLFVAGTHCQLLVAKMALTVWANIVIKHCHAILGRHEDNMLLESFMDLRNMSLSASSKLFPKEALEKVVEKLS